MPPSRKAEQKEKTQAKKATKEAIKKENEATALTAFTAFEKIAKNLSIKPKTVVKFATEAVEAVSLSENKI